MALHDGVVLVPHEDHQVHYYLLLHFCQGSGSAHLSHLVEVMDLVEQGDSGNSKTPISLAARATDQPLLRTFFKASCRSSSVYLDLK